MVTAMCADSSKIEKRAKILMLILALNETINQLAQENSGHWCSHVHRRENCHSIRSALELEVEGQIQKVE